MDTFKTRFLAARQAVIDMSLRDLNPQQRQAAEAADGPLLILAGGCMLDLFVARRDRQENKSKTEISG